MKKLFIYIMLLFTINAYSQDIIVKKDGTTILSKVIEVGDEIIKYKKWSNIDGPDYTISKTLILSINYMNGEIDNFNDTKIEGQNTTQNNQYSKEELDNAISKAAQKAAVSSRAGRGSIIAGGIITFIGLSNLISGIGIMALIDPGNGIGIGCLVGGAVVTGVGCGLISSGRIDRKHYSVNKIIKHEFKVGNYALTPSIDIYSSIDKKDKGIGAGLCLNF